MSTHIMDGPSPSCCHVATGLYGAEFTTPWNIFTIDLYRKVDRWNLITTSVVSRN